jgi:hypothetical protein
MGATRIRRMVLTSALVAAAPGLVSSCGNDPPRADAPEADGAVGSANGQGGSASPAGERSGTSGTSGSGTTREVDVKGLGSGPGARLRLEILGLERGNGGLVTGQFRVTVMTGDAPSAGWGTGRITDVNLIDPIAQKKYMVVEDSKGECLCSETPGHMTEGTVYELYATFPPVPDAVRTITVSFPDFPPIENVPLGS